MGNLPPMNTESLAILIGLVGLIGVYFAALFICKCYQKDEDEFIKGKNKA